MLKSPLLSRRTRWVPHPSPSLPLASFQSLLSPSHLRFWRARWVRRPLSARRIRPKSHILHHSCAARRWVPGCMRAPFVQLGPLPRVPVAGARPRVSKRCQCGCPARFVDLPRGIHSPGVEQRRVQEDGGTYIPSCLQIRFVHVQYSAGPGLMCTILARTRARERKRDKNLERTE
jgi:hypothetical protein